jgi:hypothetical protein
MAQAGDITSRLRSAIAPIWPGANRFGNWLIGGYRSSSV